MQLHSRRDLVKLASALIPLQLVSGLNVFSETTANDSVTVPEVPIADIFPSDRPELIRELVIVSHFDLNRVRALVSPRPSLARAAWDWGFGDWETALGAASHMGNRAIAEYLIEKGARPSLFSAAMLGQIEVVRAFIAAQPGARRIRGPHSISLLAHAKAGGQKARGVFEYLQSLGGAGETLEVSLSDADRNRILGSYVFGSSPGQQVDVTLEHNAYMKTDILTWTRKGTMGRPLYHLGERAFYPAGAEEVRIRFAFNGSDVVMTVSNPGLVLTAKRQQQT
jgi:hypothetical protein